MKKHNETAFGAAVFGEVFSKHAGPASKAGPMWMQYRMLLEKAEPLTRGKSTETDQAMIDMLLGVLPIKMDVEELPTDSDKRVLSKVTFTVKDPETGKFVAPVSLYN
jgi:hypothetical protein